MALDIGIKLNLEGYEGVMSDLRSLDNYVKQHKRTELAVSFDKAKREVIAYRAEVKKLSAELKGMDKEDAGWGEKNDQLQKAKVNLNQATTAASELAYALGKVKKQLTFGQAFNKISSSVAHVGSAMQSFGNSLTRISSPFRRFTTGILMGAGYKALNMLTSGFGGAFERYDTMNNYAKSLTALGLDASQTFVVGTGKAQTAIENLNEAVLGLPTGLDEIVAAQKIYAGATGEMVKSTKTAIAANNTFLASGTNSREQRFIQRYLASLASGAELTTTQWQSMSRIAPLAMRAVAEELGYTGGKYQSFIKDVSEGTIAGEKFLETFIKVGTEGKVQAAANVMKTTWEGLSANIQNATKRMGEGLLKTLDEVFVAYNGRNLVQNLLGFDAQGNEIGGGIKHVINDISAAAQEWVRSNPDKILEFVNKVKAIDWKGLFKGFAEGVELTVKAVGKLAGLFGGKSLYGIGKFMAIAGPLGTLLTTTGGVLKGTRHIWGFFGASAYKLLTRNGGILGGFTKMLGGNKPMETIGAAPSMMNTLRNTFKSLQGTLSVAGSIAIPVATAWGSVKALKSIINDCKEIGNLIGEVDWGAAGEALSGFAVFVGVFARVSYAASKVDPAQMISFLKGEAFIGAITTFAAGFAALDMALVKSAFGSFKDITDYLVESTNNINQIKEFETGKITDRIKNAVDAMAEVYSALKVKDGEGRSVMVASKAELKSIQTAVKGMSDIIRSVGSASDSFKELQGKKLIKKKDAQKLGEWMASIISSLNEACQSFLSTEFGNNPAELTSDMYETITNFSNAMNAITGKGGLLARMRKLQADTISNMGAQSAENVMTSVKTYLKGLFTDLKEIVRMSVGMTSTEELATKMENFANAFENIRSIFKKLKKIGKSQGDNDTNGKIPGMHSVKNLLNQLENTFTPERIGAINSQVSSFLEQINGLLDAVSKINSTDGKITVEITLKDKISGLKEVIKDIKNVQDKIQAAVNSIKTYYSKNVHVHIGANVDTSGAVSAINAGSNAVASLVPQTQQNGGAIYRANGGSIFKPRGTDIVPAMLTPGEFVHNKAAVDYFGMEFMKRVNSLDVRGAVRALMARGGAATASLNRQNIVNNTINNNQRVTQNINTNNPNMSKMSLGRFAGAF